MPESSIFSTCADRPIDEAMQVMTIVKGIGPWTAEVYLLFSAGHADVFPSGDVALQHAYAHAYCESVRPDSKALRLFAERWSPVARCCRPTFLGLLCRNAWPRWHTSRMKLK